MSMTLSVSLLSGRTASLEAEPDDLLGSLKRRAQTALTVGVGQLLDPLGALLDDATTVKKAKLQNGCNLTLQICQVRIAGSQGQFAAILGDGSVATWGGVPSRALSRRMKDCCHPGRRICCYLGRTLFWW